MKVSSLLSRTRKAFKATCDDLRTSHLWWPLFGLVVVSIPLIGWVSYQTDQTLADRELEFQFRRVKEERVLLDERGKQYDELLETLHNYCANHEEALENPLTDPGAVQRVRQVYEEAPEIKRQVQAAKDDLTGIRFTSRSATSLNALRDSKIAVLATYERLLSEDEEQLHALMSEGVIGLLEYRNDGRLDAAESLMNQKLKESEDQMSNAERVVHSAEEAETIDLERHKIEQQRRTMWVLLAEASIIYLAGIAIAISVKFGRKLKLNGAKPSTKPRKKRASSVNSRRRRK